MSRLEAFFFFVPAQNYIFKITESSRYLMAFTHCKRILHQHDSEMMMCLLQKISDDLCLVSHRDQM